MIKDLIEIFLPLGTNSAFSTLYTKVMLFPLWSKGLLTRVKCALLDLILIH